MLTTTCWFIYGPMFTPWDKRVYLHEADAKLALDNIRKAEPGVGSILGLKEVPLVLGSLGENKQIAPEAVFASDAEVIAAAKSQPKLPEVEPDPEPEAAPEPEPALEPVSDHINYDEYLDFR